MHTERSTDREEGWTFVKKNDLHEVWKKIDPDRPVHLIKVINSDSKFQVVWPSLASHTLRTGKKKRRKGLVTVHTAICLLGMLNPAPWPSHKPLAL